MDQRWGEVPSICPGGVPGFCQALSCAQPSSTLQVPQSWRSQTLWQLWIPVGWEMSPLSSPARGEPCQHLAIPCLTPLLSAPFLQQHVPDYLLPLNAAEKCCFSWILSKEGGKKSWFPCWTVFGLWFEVCCCCWKLFWPLQVFDPSDLWCLGHWFSPTPSLFLHRY